MQDHSMKAVKSTKLFCKFPEFDTNTVIYLCFNSDLPVSVILISFLSLFISQFHELFISKENANRENVLLCIFLKTV